ncbi:GNAT family N-acetyltransferase [Pseudoxanthomonas sp. UTMC 1351]|uniref:GNAT family N-acetyltransferase n=1 Tax=Pseudoxanthomonas sp. UTMC 1351 TaxID=2695853 RepID=UPI0034CFBAFC
MKSRALLETERLQLRELSASSVEDAAFILRLLNEPSFLRNIGDRGVRNLDNAHDYVANGPASSYRTHGYGLYRVDIKASGAIAGLCGLVRREGLDHPDLGYAFLPEFWSQGYALESTRAVLAHARDSLALDRILAIVDPANTDSIRLLQKLGFGFERMVQLSEDHSPVNLFVLEQ